MKIKLLTLKVLLLALFSFISGCTNPRVDMARMESIGIKNDELRYITIAKQFIRCACANNLDGMIALTSPKTLHLKGKERISEEYQVRVIPVFQKSRIEWDSSGEIIFDLNYNVGFEFSGVVRGHATTPFYISVFKEHGEVVVVNIRKTKDIRHSKTGSVLAW